MESTDGQVSENPISQTGRSVSWESPEYVYRKKSSDWYWILGIITIAFTVIAFLLNNILFAIFIVLAGSTAALYGSRKPETVRFRADTKGVGIKRQLYPYGSLDFFSINEEGEENLLILESKKKMMPHVIMPLGNTNVSELRNFLLSYLPEEYIERPWTQQLMDRLNF